MATITASTPASSIVRPILSQKRFAGVTSSVPGLARAMSKGRVSCSLNEKASVEKDSNKGMSSASLMAAICAVTMSSPAAMALVDERMSTEGTGLPFGLSNNLLGWILFGVFGLIWALYFVYVSGLEEDEESGLSL